jgi:hypothetical protein
MLRTAPTTDPVQTLQIGVGFAEHPDAAWAAVRATAMARSGLHDVTPDTALLITAGKPSADPVPTIRDVLGPVGVAGGATSMLLTEHGAVSEGALVICLANAEGAASGVATAPGRNIAEAGQAAARLILAGWPFRSRYPRGLGIAFGRQGSGLPAEGFLASWRQFMGPKMRTVCSVLSSPVLYGSSSATAVASVASVEASYATGLGWAGDIPADASPHPEALVQASVDATLTAVKRLEGQTAQLVLVVESASRREALGKAADSEWAAIRAEVGDRTPCVGWVCDHVAAYGRGVRPVDAPGSLVVVAIGPSPRS